MKNKNSIERIVVLLLILVFVTYIVPDIKNALFPDEMTRFETLLRRSALDGYNLAIDRKSETRIYLSVFKSAQSITTEIFRDALYEIGGLGEIRTFLAHSINRDADGVFYLTRTLIVADTDLKAIRRLEVSVCGRIKDQSGQVRYKDHEPIYECDGPIRKIVCRAVE